MTGPLLHFMPVIAGARHRPIPGDPYFDFISLLTEFKGRPTGYSGPKIGDMDVPKDKSSNNLPLFISGFPGRFPLGSDGLAPAEKGVSDSAAYVFDRTGGAGSAIVVGQNSANNFGENDFTVEMKVRSTNQAACDFAGRWKYAGSAGGGYSWVLSWYSAMNRIRFEISTEGRTTEITEKAEFWLSDSINDGLTKATFFDDQWHTIVVSRSGLSISISIDGMPGRGTIDMTRTTHPWIYDPLPQNALLNIGSIPADLNGIRTSTGRFKGMIDYFKITVGGATTLDVDFNDYWSMWWIGNYPQTKAPTNNVTGYDGEPIEEAGIKKSTTYIGAHWPYDVSLDLLDSDFTIEIFDLYMEFRQNSVQTVMGMGWGGPTRCWRLVLRNTGAPGTLGTLVFEYTSNGTTVTSVPIIESLAPGAVISGDLALSRFGAVLRAYWNGYRVRSHNMTGNIYGAAAASIRFGLFSNANNSDNAWETSRIKAIRYTKGKARYKNSAYRVPTLPLPKSAT